MLFVNSEDEPQLDLSGPCPGDTTLMDYVRRKIRRKLGLRLMDRGRHMILRLSRTGDCNWTSPMKEFKVCCITWID